MIKKIIVENFQKYLGVHEFELQDINFIIGSSDVGKSTLIRAICWCVNLLSGSIKFISRGKKEVKVTLIFSDNAEITKIANSSGISYVYKSSTGIIREYNKCGANIPEDLNHILNFNELNIQFQFDPYFLLNKTSTEIYNKLNDYFNFSIWDDLHKLLIKSQNEIKANQKALKQYYDDKKEYLVLNKQKFDLAKELLQKINNVLQKKNNLLSQNKYIKKYILLQKYMHLKRTYFHVYIFYIMKKLNILLLKKEKIEQIVLNLNKIKMFILLHKLNYLYLVITKINKYKQLLYFLKTIKHSKIKDINNILLQQTKEIYKRKLFLHLLVLMNNFISTTHLIENYIKMKTNKICPLCGSLIKENINEI